MKSKKDHFQEKLKEYYGEKFRNLNRHLDDYAHTGHYETLHKLRVEIKKLTALIHLLENCRQKSYSPLKLKPLHKVFHLSGKVRTSYIDRKLITQYWKKLLPRFNDNPTIEAARSQLQHRHKKYKRDLAGICKECREHLKIINDRNLNHYLRNQLALIDSFYAKPDIENLHEMRKRIKEILYLYKLLPAETPELIEKRKLLYLDQLQDTIGTWHDIDKFIKSVQTDLGIPDKPKIPVALNRERKRRLGLVEKEMSTYIGGKIVIKTG